MNAPNPSKELALRWFQKAENDLLNVENNLKATYYPADTVCFHCQQAAEKYLKGFLAWHEVPFFKIHDLLELLKQVTQIASAAEELTASLLLLDEYAVQVRYPQEYENIPGEKEVNMAVAAARIVRDWVRQYLKLEEVLRQ